MRPLPAASEVIHPAPPQTSKRGGYGKSNLCGILISPPTAGKTVGHFEYSESAQKRKRRARKVIKTFRTLIGAQAIFHFSRAGPSRSPANAGKFEIRNSADGHNTPFRALLNQLKRTTLTTYAMQLLRLPTGQRPDHGLSP